MKEILKRSFLDEFFLNNIWLLYSNEILCVIDSVLLSFSVLQLGSPSMHLKRTQPFPTAETGIKGFPKVLPIQREYLP